MSAKGAVWRLVGKPAPSKTSRGTFDMRVTDGTHVIEFLSLTNGGPADPLAWAIEQVEAFSPKDFKIACLHCPDKGLPTFVRPPKEAD